MAARVEVEIADLEVSAVPTAEPTPCVHEVIASAHESGPTIGFVSNNSLRAVEAYLRIVRNGPLLRAVRPAVSSTGQDRNSHVIRGRPSAGGWTPGGSRPTIGSCRLPGRRGIRSRSSRSAAPGRTSPPRRCRRPWTGSLTATLTGTGGEPPYTWIILGGALPPGLSLDASTSVIRRQTPAFRG
jgi:hypothetical protein